MNLHQGLYLDVLDKTTIDYTLARGPIGNNFSRPRFPVNLHQGLYLYVLNKTTVDYTLALGPIRNNWSNSLKVGPG